MNKELFIAKRVAFSGKRSFSRLIINISIAAVAMSMVVMIMATALISGFKKEITNKIFGFWGHITIESFESNGSFESVPISRDQEFYTDLDTFENFGYIGEQDILGIPTGSEGEKRTNGGISHIQSYATKAGIIKTASQFEGIILKGVGDDYNWGFLADNLVEGRIINLQDTSASEDILISQTTARRLNLKVEDKFVVHFVISEQQLKRRFTISGIYKTGLEEYDQKFAVCDIRRIQNLYGWAEDQVSGFEVFVDDIDDLDPIGEVVYDQLPMGLYSRTVRRSHPNIFGWLELQNINEVVILALMLAVCIINMITALIILILERTNMIGTLKALGERNSSIQKIFLFYAAYIIGLGLLWGNGIGLLLCFLQYYFEIITLPEADYYVSVAPIDINWWVILGLNIGTLLVTLIMLIIPSFLVMRITPVRAMRFK